MNTITISIAALLYDIALETYLKSRSIDNGDNRKEASKVYATEDKENRNCIMSSIREAIAEIIAVMTSYVNEIDPQPDGEAIAAESTLTLHLNLPLNFDMAVIPRIKESILSSIRSKAIYNWYRITLPEAAAQYQTLAENEINRISVWLNKRVRPERDTY